jgi:hypothetical protein
MTSLQHRIWVFLTFRGRSILEALIVALCAGDEFVLERIRMQKVVLRTEKYVSELPFTFFLGFKLALYLLEYVGIGRFSKLSIERKLRRMEIWETSGLGPQRNLFKLMKAACVCHIFSEQRLLADIGYGDNRVARAVALRRRGVEPAT